jgi:hypothetical protein
MDAGPGAGGAQLDRNSALIANVATAVFRHRGVSACIAGTICPGGSAEGVPEPLIRPLGQTEMQRCPPSSRSLEQVMPRRGHGPLRIMRSTAEMPEIG